MKRQKICIIGGSLTGLVTAISLSKLNCEIDLITGNDDQNPKSNRTIAISEDNCKTFGSRNRFWNEIAIALRDTTKCLQFPLKFKCAEDVHPRAPAPAAARDNGRPGTEVPAGRTGERACLILSQMKASR